MKKRATKNAAAVALGKMGKGRKKTLTPAARKQRQEASQKALAKRLAKDDRHFQLPPGPVREGWDDDEE